MCPNHARASVFLDALSLDLEFWRSISFAVSSPSLVPLETPPLSFEELVYWNKILAFLSSNVPAYPEMSGQTENMINSRFANHRIFPYIFPSTCMEMLVFHSLHYTVSSHTFLHLIASSTCSCPMPFLHYNFPTPEMRTPLTPCGPPPPPPPPPPGTSIPSTPDFSQLLPRGIVSTLHLSSFVVGSPYFSYLRLRFPGIVITLSSMYR